MKPRKRNITIPNPPTPPTCPPLILKFNAVTAARTLLCVINISPITSTTTATAGETRFLENLLGAPKNHTPIENILLDGTQSREIVDPINKQGTGVGGGGPQAPLLLFLPLSYPMDGGSVDNSSGGTASVLSSTLPSLL